MLTRKQIIDNVEALDAEIEALQQSKRETYEDHRANLVATDGKEVAKAEIEGLKKAVQRRRQVSKHGVEAVEQKDALVEEILAEVANAPRATRVASDVPIEHEPADPTPSGVAAAGGGVPPGSNTVSAANQSTADVVSENPVAHEPERTAKAAGTDGRLEGHVQPEGAPAKVASMSERTAVRVPAGSHSEPDQGQSGGMPAQAPRQATGEASSDASSVVPFVRKTSDRPRSSSGLERPYGCLNVDSCAKTWRDTEACSMCRAAIQVEPSGVHIAHRGDVG